MYRKKVGGVDVQTCVYNMMLWAQMLLLLSSSEAEPATLRICYGAATELSRYRTYLPITVSSSSLPQHGVSPKVRA